MKQNYQLIQQKVNKLTNTKIVNSTVKEVLDAIPYMNGDSPINEYEKKVTYSSLAFGCAVTLDEDYKGHIKRCKTLFIMNEITEKPEMIDVKALKETNPKYVDNLVKTRACFRTREDISAVYIFLSDIKEKLNAGE